MRKLFFLLFAIGSLCGALAQTNRPNIIFILAADADAKYAVQNNGAKHG